MRELTDTRLLLLLGGLVVVVEVVLAEIVVFLLLSDGLDLFVARLDIHLVGGVFGLLQVLARILELEFRQLRDALKLLVVNFDAAGVHGGEATGHPGGAGDHGLGHVESCVLRV